MHWLTVAGRIFVASALVAFGIQHLVYADFITRLVPKLPAWIPAQPTLAYLFGAVLIAGGIALAKPIRKARPVALVLGSIIFLSFAALYLPRLLPDLRNGGLWTQAFKALGFTGALFAIAATLPRPAPATSSSPPAESAPTDSLLLLLARIFFGSFLVLCCILHFIYKEFVDTLVPAWIPAARFWTYFSAIALLAGGIGIVWTRTLRLAGLLTGLMIFIWFLILHIPRAFAGQGPNETTAVFEALAFSGLAFILAVPRSAAVPAPAPTSAVQQAA